MSNKTANKDNQAKFYVEPEFSLKNEWSELFGKESLLSQLKRSAFGGNLGTSAFRSVCWRIFWECLSEQPEKWKEDVVEKREWYSNIRKKYVINPHNQDEQEEADLEKHHPLSLAEDSIWNKYFQDNELRSLIIQDLDRLYPEIEFFQQENIKNYILNILFCYAREHPQVAYKQGMHEILSPLVYVIYNNAVRVKESKEKLSDDIKMVVDFTHIEHDAYCLFFNIMESVQPWYVDLRPIETLSKPNHSGQKSSNMFQNPDTKPVNAISNKLQRIQGSMLQKYDPELATHLKKIEVSPQVYGIRWVRLLFGREFPMSQLMILWDAIFAGGMALEIVEYIYVAMLMHLRGYLIQSDFSQCLSYLMKFPQSTDPRMIIRRAIELKKSKNKPHTPQHQHQHHHHHHQHTSNSPLTTNRRQQPPQQRPPLKHQQRSHTGAQRNTSGDVPRTKPSIHPVKYRLGETEEQRYAQALGSGSQTVSFAKTKKDNSRSNFYVQDSVDGKDSQQESGEVIKAEFSKEKVAAEKPGMTANIRERMGSGAQIISRLPNTLKDVMTSPRQDNNVNNQTSNGYVNAIIEDHTRLQRQVSELKSDLDTSHEMAIYCSQKMDFYLTLMQERFFQAENFNDELTILGLAGLKQVREILKGQDMDDVDFGDIDRHVQVARQNIDQIGQGNEGEVAQGESPKLPIPIMADFDHFKRSDSRESGKNLVESEISESLPKDTPNDSQTETSNIFEEKAIGVETPGSKGETLFATKTPDTLGEDASEVSRSPEGAGSLFEDLPASKFPDISGVDLFTTKSPDAPSEGLFTNKSPDAPSEGLFTNKSPDVPSEGLFTNKSSDTPSESLFETKAPGTSSEDLFTNKAADTLSEDSFASENTKTPKDDWSDPLSGLQ